MNESWDIKNMASNKKQTKGMMVFYIDVGQLPPYKAEAFVERWKDTCKKQTKKLRKSGIESIWIPVRPNSQTCVEFLPMTEEGQNFILASDTKTVDELIEIE